MKEVQGNFRENVLDLILSGRIDSNNASQVQEAINQIIGSHTVDQVQIDAHDLQYISSAGLRVLLRLKKQIEDLTLKDVNSEIYEILEMTGFTEMMKVEKAYRQVDIEGCEVIGQGSNGTIYRIDQDNVVKVYNNADALKDIQHEREVARTALVLGIPTAISYDVVKVGDHYGSVFELLNARSFANILVQEPERFQWCVNEFAGMLSRIHSTVVPPGKLPDMKETVMGWVRDLKDKLPDNAWQKLRKMVDQIPRDNHMLHGDYHIKNLVLQGDEVLLIDMDTLAAGHPVFELCSMYNAFAGFSEYDHNTVKSFLGIDYETSLKFWHQTLACYLGTDDADTIKETEDKARILGYVRLIRRSIRRGRTATEKGYEETALWKSHLLELLENVDSLLFTRNEIMVDANVDNLQDVLSFVNAHLESAGCDPRIRHKIEMSVEELFVNIASYAYRRNTGNVIIHAQIRNMPESGHEIIITFTDHGIPFDPMAKDDPDVSLDAEKRSIGGLGIYLVKKIMDDVRYIRKDNSNILTIRKKF